MNVNGRLVGFQIYMHLLKLGNLHYQRGEKTGSNYRYFFFKEMRSGIGLIHKENSIRPALRIRVHPVLSFLL